MDLNDNGDKQASTQQIMDRDKDIAAFTVGDVCLPALLPEPETMTHMHSSGCEWTCRRGKCLN